MTQLAQRLFRLSMNDKSLSMALNFIFLNCYAENFTAKAAGKTVAAELAERAKWVLMIDTRALKEIKLEEIDLISFAALCGTQFNQFKYRLDKLSENERAVEIRSITRAILLQRIDEQKQTIQKHWNNRHKSVNSKSFVKTGIMLIKTTLKELNLLLH